MSRIKTKRIKRAGISLKKDIRKARSYAHTFVKCNMGYAINNMAYHNGLAPWFSNQSTILKPF